MGESSGIPETTKQLITTMYGISLEDKRRVPHEERKIYNIKNMWQLHHEICNLKLLGYSNERIATALSVTPQTVSNTVNSSLGKAKLQLLRDARDEEAFSLQKELANMTKDAVDVLSDILSSETASDETKRKTSMNVLVDLGGHGAAARVSISHSHVFQNNEEVKEAISRGLAFAQNEGIIDADYEVISQRAVGDGTVEPSDEDS